MKQLTLIKETEKNIGEFFQLTQYIHVHGISVLTYSEFQPRINCANPDVTFVILC